MADGEQRRDFIWVGDVVDVMLWLLDTSGASGLFNVGTGQARSLCGGGSAGCDDRVGERGEGQLVDPHQADPLGVGNVYPLPEPTGPDDDAALGHELIDSSGIAQGLGRGQWHRGN